MTQEALFVTGRETVRSSARSTPHPGLDIPENTPYDNPPQHLDIRLFLSIFRGICSRYCFIMNGKYYLSIIKKYPTIDRLTVVVRLCRLAQMIARKVWEPQMQVSDWNGEITKSARIISFSEMQPASSTWQLPH
jgi:hypothetical protein